MNHEAVYRTAPATPGLLKTKNVGSNNNKNHTGMEKNVNQKKYNKKVDRPHVLQNPPQKKVDRRSVFLFFVLFVETFPNDKVQYLLIALCSFLTLRNI